MQPWGLYNKETLSNDEAHQFADESLKSDREIVMTAIKSDGLVLQFAAEEVKADRGIVLNAVRKKYFLDSALKYCSDVLKADREIVLTAIQADGFSLQYV